MLRFLGLPLAAVLAGGNLVNTYPGIVGSLLGQSFEGLVIDNDMMGSVLRVLRGIEVTDETLSYQEIAATVAVRLSCTWIRGGSSGQRGSHDPPRPHHNQGPQRPGGECGASDERVHSGVTNSVVL